MVFNSIWDNWFADFYLLRFNDLTSSPFQANKATHSPFFWGAGSSCGLCSGTEQAKIYEMVKLWIYFVRENIVCREHSVEVEELQAKIFSHGITIVYEDCED